MPLSEKESRDMYESTIRSEVKIDAINRRLDKGDTRFEKIEKLTDEHAAQLKEIHGDKKRWAGWSKMIAGALALPAMAWVWDHLVKFFGGGGNGAGGGP